MVYERLEQVAKVWLKNVVYNSPTRDFTLSDFKIHGIEQDEGDYYAIRYSIRDNPPQRKDIEKTLLDFFGRDLVELEDIIELYCGITFFNLAKELPHVFININNDLHNFSEELEMFLRLQ